MRNRLWLLGVCLASTCVAACSDSSPVEAPAQTGGSAGAGGSIDASAGSGGTGGATATGGAGGADASSAQGGAAGTGGSIDAGTDGAPAVDAAADATPDAARDARSEEAGPTSGVKGHPDPAAQYPTYPGFTLYLVEEFNAPIDLDADPYWTWGDGTINDGLARFGEEAITFSDGKMKITVSEGDTPAGYSVVKGGDVPARTLKSGEMRSKYNMFRWGRYEASIKPPAAETNFILSMFTFRTPHYQEWREIDFELLASLASSVSTNVIIGGPNKTGWSASDEEPASTYPFGVQPAQALPAGFSAADFHTYAFEALPDHITYYVDGVPVRTKETGVGTNQLSVPELSMKVMFNHWVFDGTAFGGGNPALNTYPFTGEYDWFRFYKWDQDTAYPCDPIPACLPAADTDFSANNPKEATAP